MDMVNDEQTTLVIRCSPLRPTPFHFPSYSAFVKSECAIRFPFDGMMKREEERGKRKARAVKTKVRVYTTTRASPLHTCTHHTYPKRPYRTVP